MCKNFRDFEHEISWNFCSFWWPKSCKIFAIRITFFMHFFIKKIIKKTEIRTRFFDTFRDDFFRKVIGIFYVFLTRFGAFESRWKVRANIVRIYSFYNFWEGRWTPWIDVVPIGPFRDRFGGGRWTPCIDVVPIGLVRDPPRGVPFFYLGKFSRFRGGRKPPETIQWERHGPPTTHQLFYFIQIIWIIK